MINNKYLEILKTEEFQYLENSHKVVEKDRRNRFIMTLNILKKSENLYSIFCCEGNNGKADYSRMTFIKNVNFPDQLLMQVDSDKIIFHVIELKKKPTNDLSKMEKQFIGANLHIRALTGIWGISEYEVKYYVYYVNEDIPLAKKYSQMTNLVKGIPGEAAPPTDQKLANWFSSRIKTTFGMIEIDEPIIKINVLETLNDNNYTRYLSEISI